MIIVDKRKLKFLLRGRVILVDSPRVVRRGRDYAVGVRAGTTVCRALIVSVTQTSDGWRLELVQYRGDAPRYLARNPAAQRTDYVSEPSRAAWDENGPLEAGTDDARAYQRDDQLRRLRAKNERVAHWRKPRV